METSKQDNQTPKSTNGAQKRRVPTILAQGEPRVITDVFESFTEDDFRSLAVSMRVPDSFINADSDVSTMRKYFVDCVYETGLEVVLEKCNLPLLRGLSGDGDEEEGTKKRKRNVVSELINRVMKTGGVVTFLGAAEQALVDGFGDKLGIEKPNTAAQIELVVRASGLLKFFKQFDVDQLQKWAEAAEIEVNSRSHKRLAHALTYGKDHTPPNRRLSVPKERAPLNKDITIEQLNVYTVPELKSYCAKHDLTQKRGSKALYLKSVFKHLTGTEPDHLPQKPKKVRVSESESEEEEDKSDQDFKIESDEEVASADEEVAA